VAVRRRLLRPLADYLKWLALNGYTLSPIEDVITGARRADDVYDETLRKEDAA
jgi:ParB family transcriptional regulator, chromosome partitioning protein